MKFPDVGLVRSSLGRGWVGIGAEVHTHPAGLIIEGKTSADTDLAIALGGSSDAIIRRKSGQNLDECTVAPGTVWICPAGVMEEIVETSATTPEILHVFLSRKIFANLADDDLRGIDPYEYVSYANGHQDPLIGQCGFAIAQELRQQTSTGRILIEAVVNTLAARMVHANIGRPANSGLFTSRAGLDRLQLLRVLDAIDAGLEDDLSLAWLASVVGLSPRHCARAFKASMGMSLHQYVSARRLHRAKDLVLGGATSLPQIAFRLGFSNQAQFSRAFRAATGLTPMAYKLALTE